MEEKRLLDYKGFMIFRYKESGFTWKRFYVAVKNGHVFSIEKSLSFLWELIDREETKNHEY